MIPLTAAQAVAAALYVTAAIADALVRVCVMWVWEAGNE